jgi:hypothetical protein
MKRNAFIKHRKANDCILVREGGNPDIHRGIGNVGGMDREVLGGNADVGIVRWKAKVF